jgi:hypothetical protein
MKYLASVAFCVLIASQTLVAQVDSLTAAPAGRSELVYSAGLALPYLPKDFGNGYRTGYTVGMGGGYAFAPGSLGYGALYGTVCFTNFAFSVQKFKDANNLQTGTYNIQGASTQIVTIGGSFKGTFATDMQSIAPFFDVGLGYMHVFSPPISVTGAQTMLVDERESDQFFWDAGAGLDFPVTRHITVFLEGQFFIGVRADGSMQYFPFTIGLRGEL